MNSSQKGLTPVKIVVFVRSLRPLFDCAAGRGKTADRVFLQLSCAME